MQSSKFLLLPGVLCASFLLLFGATADASESNCTQNRVDGSTVPKTNAMIYPAKRVVPFYQWENNNGYCGEVSMIQAGLNNGQWMSQFHARLICGSGLSQSGLDGWCKTHQNVPNYNAQLLLESANTGVTGTQPFSSAPVCLANARLSAATYPYVNGYRSANSGLSGYKDYLRWIKSEMIAGHQVTIGVMFKESDDPQYDHIVSVMAIGTNHSLTDASYYDDDVLYFDDHGAYDLDGDSLADPNPAIPYGAGDDNTRCTPYVFAYTFASLAKTRKQANLASAQAYSIIIPGPSISALAGGDGSNYLPRKINVHNYGFSVAGAIDKSVGGPYLKPVTLAIISATATNGKVNPKDPIAGWQYENSMIGLSETGNSCTNTPPQYAMSPVVFRVTVSGLKPGTSYNLYEYNASGVTGKGTGAALAVPTENFNRNAALASSKTSFVATTDSYAFTVSRTSDKIIVFRVVAASAP